jgi:hypothetical protein
VEGEIKRMMEMSERTCWRCGKGLPLGELNYVVHIKVFAGFDGLLLEPEERIERQLRRLMDQVDKSDPEELEKEVYEEFTLLFCKSCRDRFVGEIQHPWEGRFQIRIDPERIVH